MCGVVALMPQPEARSDQALYPQASSNWDMLRELQNLKMLPALMLAPGKLERSSDGQAQLPEQRGPRRDGDGGCSVWAGAARLKLERNAG